MLKKERMQLLRLVRLMSLCVLIFASPCGTIIDLHGQVDDVLMQRNLCVERLCVFRDIIFIYGRGTIVRSIDGGDNWQVVLSYDSVCARLSIGSMWTADSILNYSFSYPALGSHYFQSIDGREWSMMTDKFIPKVNIKSINGRRVSNETGYKVIGSADRAAVDIENAHFMSMMYENENLDSLFTGLFMLGKDSLWTRVVSVPSVGIQFRQGTGISRDMRDVMLGKNIEGMIVLYIDSIGLYYSRDKGDTWQSAGNDAVALPKLIDFGEWNEYFIYLDKNKNFGKIKKESLFAVY